MALKTINDLTALTTPAATDLIGVWSVSAGRMRKSTLAQVVSQSGVAALLASANTFTTTQAISPATAAAGLTITMAASFGTASAISVAAVDNGTGGGPIINISPNNNGSTPAAGTINLRTSAAAQRFLWNDTSNLLRTHTAAPSSGGGVADTAGTVVGSQSSHVKFKEVLGGPVADGEALAALVAAAADVKRFRYKSGAYNGQEFSGLVLDGETLHRYGEDGDAEHPAGKSLNVINAIGDMMLALREVERRLALLEG